MIQTRIKPVQPSANLTTIRRIVATTEKVQVPTIEALSIVSSSSNVQAMFRSIMELNPDLDLIEYFYCLFLNRANKVIGFSFVSKGGQTATIADPRVILRDALLCGACSMILCHNHPSGSIKPSRADEELTSKIKSAASYLDIRVLDHIILGDSDYFSFADEGIM